MGFNLGFKGVMNPLVYYLVYKNPPIFLILSQVNSFLALRNDFFKAHFNLNFRRRKYNIYAKREFNIDYLH